jgi:glycosyltransferase involved in cell wall biosynthesis
MTVPVSVIIPCYCCSETIERAVVSVANQTNRPYELILVNDASTDDTICVINSIKNLCGDWIKIIDLPINVGAASSRNIGWSLATQKYIAFLDSDDAWHQEKIRIQYQYMKNNPDIALCGHSFRELSQNDQMGLNWQVDITKVQKVTWKKILIKNQFVTPSVMIKKDIPYRFLEGRRYMEDHLLWLEIVGDNLLAAKLNVDLTALYKPNFGASGLSSNMWLMEKAELLNYKYLHNQKKIKFYQYLFLYCFSFAKFIRRILIVYFFRRIWR